MALVKMKDLLRRAEEKNIGCGAFSVGNMEMVRGAIRAAEELDTPVILQIAEVRLKNSPLHLMGPMMVQAAKEAKVDVAVHLDHGLTFETVDKALELGFTSVMLDASTLPFEEMQTMIKGVYSPERFLEIFRDYIYFQDSEYDSEEREIVCRYPQFFATRLLKQSIIKSVIEKSGKGGTYFGATGCGKSYTMAFLARQLALR